jgi:hypothetical protein
MLALALGLVGIGAAALITIGGIPGAITGVVLAVAGLAALHWDVIKDMFNGILEALGAFIGGLGKAWEEIKHALGLGIPPKDKQGAIDDTNGLLIQPGFHPHPGKEKPIPINLT